MVATKKKPHIAAFLTFLFYLAVAYGTINTVQLSQQHRLNWRPQGDSNPCTHRERVMS